MDCQHTSIVRPYWGDRQGHSKEERLCRLLEARYNLYWKSENECRLWVDRNKQTLVKLGTPYEVA